MRKNTFSAAVLSSSLLFACLSCGGAKQKTQEPEQTYKPEWESLQHYEAPEWYKDAKLGFWAIWGVYSVPAYMGDHAAEWYGRWMYSHERQGDHCTNGYATHLHHKKTYGDPAEFGYKDFIPMWKAEKFDANEWADVADRMGAKFLSLIGVFHDNFCLWDTKLSKWNSVGMGPKRDFVAEVKEAAYKKNLKFGVSNHSAWNYMFFMWNHIHGYDAKQPGLEDLYGTPVISSNKIDTARWYEGETRDSWFKRTRNFVKPSSRDLDRWLERTEELAAMYSPDLYYFDWGFNVPEFESRRKEFGAFYYNHAVKNGQGSYGKPGVVINYKNKSFATGSAVLDFERGGKNEISPLVWQTDDSVYDGHNWGYAEGVSVKSPDIIIDELLDIVSKNGVLMLAFAPKADGSIPQNQKELAYAIGDWLKICGEAIYATRPYKLLGEVSPKWGAKNEVGYKTYIGTSEDIRYTRSKDNKTLFATILDWPTAEKVCIKTLADLDAAKIQSVQMLGVDKPLEWKQTPAGLEISLPSKPDYGYAYPIKISM